MGTGLERDIFESICQYLLGDNSRFDYIGIANEIVTGKAIKHSLIFKQFPFF